MYIYDYIYIYIYILTPYQIFPIGYYLLGYLHHLHTWASSPWPCRHRRQLLVVLLQGGKQKDNKTIYHEVFICTYIYIYVFVLAYLYLYTYIYIYISFLHMYIHIYVHIFICIYIHKYTYGNSCSA